jgi:serine/threonine protein kinase/transcriptional regulator with XRE-family HTH domain
MDATSPRWRQVTPSQHAWEAEALDRLRALLPDADPFFAWSNFEFTDGGRIHEADALVITPKGAFLIEIKSWSGRVTGDQGTWVQERKDGSRLSFNNPARLNTAKVRSLASLIRRNWPGGPTAPHPPFITSLVWFSNPDLRIALPQELRGQIAVAEENTTAAQIQTLPQAILQIGEAEANNANFRRVSADQANAFASTMDRIGFKESTRTRTAGSYELQLPAFAERGSTQDFMAKHKLHGLQARVRIYSNVVDASAEDARALKDAATREFLATKNLSIDGIVRAIDSDMTDFGPAVIFEHHPKAIRLDRFMAERGDDLSIDDRLHIVEQLALTLREMHRRSITHRMLTPESIWLRPVHTDTPGVDRWEPLISDFSLAARESSASTTVATYTRVGSLPAARTGAVEVVLGDPAMETYLAPEAFTDPNADGVALDVFSVGALTYLLCTDRSPAESRADMRNALGARGLSVTAVRPELDAQLDALVRSCTTPIVSDRLAGMPAVADAVALLRNALAGDTEDGPTEVDPIVANEGDVLGDRFEVKRRLGKGSTAVALWCHDRTHERDVVLKVALAGTSAERLGLEADALRNLRQANVVELYEQVELSGRPVLVLSFAGDRSLARYLRDEGALSTEFLRRWGEDLLEAVRYLEKVGVAHRDVKPDNLGIVEMGPHRKSHLVLFDFSLAGASADDVMAGTPPYLDPFLSDEGRQRYDLAAERYAAAVTIHEMATGETPTWGDGQSDPAYLPDDVQATVLVEAIDPEVRTAVAEFLAKALRRHPGDRFDTADDMARAWLAAFEGWESSGDSDDDSTESTPTPGGLALPDTLTLDDPIGSLPSSQKVRSALRKLGAETVRGAAAVEPMAVNRSRGVSVKTRKAILRLRAAVLERFADELAAPTTTRPTATTEPSGTTPTPDRPAVADTRPDLDELGLRLVPPRGKSGPAGSVADTVRVLLGLDPIDDLPDGLGNDWPTVSATAERMGVTQGAVSNWFQKARKHWAESPELMAAAADLLDTLADLGGVAGVSELSEPLIDRRGTGNDPADARRLANAVVRAVLESASPVADCFSIRRFGRRTLVAVNGPAIAAVADADHNQAPSAALDPTAVQQLGGINPAPLIDLAVALGTRADELVATNSLVSSTEAVPALRAVRADAGRSLSDARLVRLAAAASDRAATNAASDLVPMAASAVDALRWSRTSLIGSAQLREHELAARVAARFPAASLPTRPKLDELIAAAGLPLTWSDKAQAYVTPDSPGGVGPLTEVTSLRAPVLSVGGTSFVKPLPAEPEIAAALRIDERLEHSLSDGGFLALRVPTDRLVDAQRGLARFQTGVPPISFVDLEATFLRHLRVSAEGRKIDWANLEGADDPDDLNWPRLSVVAGAAVDATIDEVTAAERVIAWFPGALVRHAPNNQTAPLDRLREATTNAKLPLRTLWLVVLGTAADALPTVDGTPVPALATGERLDLTSTWLHDDHRAGGLTA